MRINIIGCAYPEWQDAPPVNSGQGLCWGVNDLIYYRPVDAVIDCHDLKAVLKGKLKLGRRQLKDIKDELRIIKKTDTPFYTLKKFKNIPSSRIYPLQQIMKHFDTDYFTSGIDYAVALAIYKKVTELHIYGVLLLNPSEYYAQKFSLEFWIGVAKGSGAKVTVHGDRSELLKSYNRMMYGYNLPQKAREISRAPEKAHEANNIIIPG